MNELKVLDFHGKQVIDSRDVAQMVGRNHNELLKTIRSYCDYLDQGEIAQVDFFIESTYVDAQNRTLNAAPIRVSFPEGVSLSGLAKLISVTRRVMLDAGSSPYDVCGMVRETFGAVGFPVPSTFPKQIPGQLSLFDRPALH